jgi:hypothetical protein
LSIPTVVTVLRDPLWQTIGVLIDIVLLLGAIVELVDLIIREKQTRKQKLVKLGISLLLIAIVVPSTIFAVRAIPSSGSGAQKRSVANTTSWQTVLTDPLTSTRHDPAWEVDDDQCFFQNGLYVLKSLGPNYCNYGSPPAQNFHDLDYSLDLAIH